MGFGSFIDPITKVIHHGLHKVEGGISSGAGKIGLGGPTDYIINHMRDPADRFVDGFDQNMKDNLDSISQGVHDMQHIHKPGDFFKAAGEIASGAGRSTNLAMLATTSLSRGAFAATGVHNPYIDAVMDYAAGANDEAAAMLFEAGGVIDAGQRIIEGESMMFTMLDLAMIAMDATPTGFAYGVAARKMDPLMGPDVGPFIGRLLHKLNPTKGTPQQLADHAAKTKAASEESMFEKMASSKARMLMLAFVAVLGALIAYGLYRTEN